MAKVYEVRVDSDGHISYKKVNEDYYSLNLNVSAQIKMFGFEILTNNITKGNNSYKFLMDFDFDFNQIPLKDKNASFKKSVKWIKEIKSTIRDQKINVILN